MGMKMMKISKKNAKARKEIRRYIAGKLGISEGYLTKKLYRMDTDIDTVYSKIRTKQDEQSSCVSITDDKFLYALKEFFQRKFRKNLEEKYYKFETVKIDVSVGKTVSTKAHNEVCDKIVFFNCLLSRSSDNVVTMHYQNPLSQSLESVDFKSVVLSNKTFIKAFGKTFEEDKKYKFGFSRPYSYRIVKRSFKGHLRHGLTLINDQGKACLMFGDYNYHFTTHEDLFSPSAIIDRAFNYWKRQKNLESQRKLNAVKEKIVNENLDKIFIDFEDSTSSGNCEAYTNQISSEVKHSLGIDHDVSCSLRADVVRSYVEQKYPRYLSNFSRAVFKAADHSNIVNRLLIQS